MLLQLKLSKSLALQTAGFFYGRSTANQERGTKNQEQPRSGSQLQLTLCGPPSSEILHPSSAQRATVDEICKLDASAPVIYQYIMNFRLLSLLLIHSSLFAIPPQAANQEPAGAKIGENLSLIVNLLSDHFF